MYCNVLYSIKIGSKMNSKMDCDNVHDKFAAQFMSRTILCVMYIQIDPKFDAQFMTLAIRAPLGARAYP